MTSFPWFPGVGPGTIGLAGVAGALLASSACEPWDPPAREVTFELRGKHAVAPCESCHTDLGPPVTSELYVCGGLTETFLADPCLDCHECDRPDPDHFAGKSCGNAGCHTDAALSWTSTGTVTETGTTGIHPGTCSGTCHGDAWPDNSPRDDSHHAHLQQTTLRAAELACDDCHPAGDADAPTHDDGNVDLPFGTLATTGGLAPTFEPGTGTCSGTYCHGAGMQSPGPDPTWDEGPAASACDACHGYPPPSPHPSDPDCSACHPTTGGSNETLGNKATHLDGIPEF